MAVGDGLRLKKAHSLCVLLFCLCVSAGAQDAGNNSGGNRLPIHLRFSTGAALAMGKTPTMVDTGGAMIVGLEFGRKRRLSWPINFDLLFGNVPGTTLQQTGNAIGTSLLFGLTEDPTFVFAKGSRWGAYVSGGGGVSWKQVQLWANSDSCQDTYYCSPSSQESSFQPMVDAGLGVNYRIHPQSLFQLYAEVRYVKAFTPSGLFPGFNAAGTEVLAPTFGFQF